MNLKLRNGRSYEKVIAGKLLYAGFDVYSTEVDDQGIDGIIRVSDRRGLRYYDFQSKGSSKFSSIRGKISKQNKSNDNMLLFLYSSETGDLLWFRCKDIKKYFKPTNPRFGDIFINKKDERGYEARGHKDLEKLRSLL